MIRRFLICLVVLAITQAACGENAAVAAGSQEPHDISGAWQLDRSRSESPRPPMRGGWGGGRSGRRGGGHGGWGQGDRDRDGGMPGEGDSSRAAGRRMRLPETLRITQSAGEVRLEDSLGTPIQIILTGGVVADSTQLAPGAQWLTGQWKGDRLEVKHADDRGSTTTETYSLVDKGRSLEVKTKTEGRRTFEFKRIYARVGT